MAWRRVPEEHIELLANLAQRVPDAERRAMFGCPVYFINGNMFFGAHQDQFILRLPDNEREAALQHPGVTSFMPMGRPMREYIAFHPSTFSPDEMLKWVQRAADCTRELPVKEKKIIVK